MTSREIWKKAHTHEFLKNSLGHVCSNLHSKSCYHEYYKYVYVDVVYRTRTTLISPFCFEGRRH